MITNQQRKEVIDKFLASPEGLERLSITLTPHVQKRILRWTGESVNRDDCLVVCRLLAKYGIRKYKKTNLTKDLEPTKEDIMKALNKIKKEKTK